MGHVPSAVDMDDRGRFSSVTYWSQLGSWNQAVRLAGFEPYKLLETRGISTMDQIGRHVAGKSFSEIITPAGRVISPVRPPQRTYMCITFDLHGDLFLRRKSIIRV